ncbi:MAG: acyl-CoA thioesterase [Bacteroidales bacterium]|nr:acyl-CoA thioesterase [Bacteroidales bacterium]MBN2747942.1 acyl-CoA thioesterase [Bacteroidales bacterium]
MTNNSAVSHYKVVFPSDLNNNDTLFGGLAMQWMDQIAYIAAIRFARKKMVTVSVGSIKFSEPVKPGVIIEIKAKVVTVKAARLNVLVEIFQETIASDTSKKSVEALFTFAAVDESGKPVRIC